MLQRLPIRIRVTLAFVAVMAVVFAGMGLFIYVRQGVELRDTVDQGLRSRASDVATLVRGAETGLPESGRSPLTETGESVAQILDRRGRVVDAPPALRDKPIVGAVTVRRAGRGTLLVNRATVPTSDGETRLLVAPVVAHGDRLVVVVGASLEALEQSQHSLGALLALAGLGALACAAAAGFGVVTAALAPMEAMRRRAGEIHATQPGARLPVPEAEDEVHRLGETLNSMLDRLEDAFARERQFVSDSSHELRTPLAILKAELELALWTDASPQELRAAISSAVEESDRLSELAEDLLVIARADDGRLPVRCEPVRVRQLLERVGRRFELRAAEHQTEIVVECREGEQLEGDPMRLEQALGNLVENALRHGAGPVTLAGARSAEGAAVLKVSDRGAGFGDGFASYAFERFSREDSARGRAGAGLGLAIVETIAQAHGGEVRASNRSDGGAEVALTVPATSPARPAVPAPA